MSEQEYKDLYEDLLEDLSQVTFTDFPSLLHAAKLDFHVRLEDMQYKTQATQEIGLKDENTGSWTAAEVPVWHEQNKVKAVVRNDDDWIVGTGSPKYGIVQYDQALQITEALFQEYSALRVHRGGPINHGERAVLVLDAEGRIELAEDDPIINRIHVYASHDSSTKVTVRVVPYRKLTGAPFPVFGNSGTVFSAKHTKKVQERLQKAQETIQGVKLLWNSFTDDFSRLSKHKVSHSDARDLIKVIFGHTDEAKQTTERDNIEAKVWERYRNGTANRMYASIQGTLAGLVLAVSEYAAHDKTVRQSQKNSEDAARFLALTEGAAAKQVATAWDAAMKFKNSGLTGILKKK